MIGRRLLGLLAGVLALVALPNSVAAHAGHGHTASRTLVVPVVLFLGGIAVLAGSVYADHRDVLDRTLTNVGVLVGVLATLVGIAGFWV